MFVVVVVIVRNPKKTTRGVRPTPTPRTAGIPRGDRVIAGNGRALHIFAAHVAILSEKQSQIM